MWDKDKFVGWLSVGAMMMMNILAQLRSGDKEIWGKIERTKEFEWDKGGDLLSRYIGYPLKLFFPLSSLHSSSLALKPSQMR